MGGAGCFNILKGVGGMAQSQKTSMKIVMSLQIISYPTLYILLKSCVCMVDHSYWSSNAPIS